MEINPYEKNYKALLLDTISSTLQEVRDGNYAYAQAGVSIEFKSNFNEFPMLTSKEMYFKNIKYELHWLLSGSTNINYLKDNGVSIWNLWADDDGDIGNTYGRVLRSFNNVDQFKEAIIDLQKNSQSRRIVCSMWNPELIKNGEMAPCYFAFQFVQINKVLNIIVSQRSADLFIGLPYDMCVFTLLLNIVAKKLNLIKGKVRINIGNAHVYKEHIDVVNTYIKAPMYKLSKLVVAEDISITGFDVSKVYIQDYVSEKFLKAKIII